MNVSHKVAFPRDRITIEDVLTAITRWDIPSHAEIFESGEDYCIWIEWADE